MFIMEVDLDGGRSRLIEEGRPYQWQKGVIGRTAEGVNDGGRIVKQEDSRQQQAHVQ